MTELPSISKLKDTIQDSNVNFLIGSGLSADYLSPLGNIEILLSELDAHSDLQSDKKDIIRTSLYKRYFDLVISKNVDLLENDKKSSGVLGQYEHFLKAVNSLILSRKSTILSKQINLFTTNVDIFLERALDNTHLEYNDGFSGRFAPTFELSNFKKLLFKTSLHYDNRSAIPVFNLLKIHGSLTWYTHGETIILSPALQTVKDVNAINVPADKLVAVDEKSTIDTLIEATDGMTVDDSLKRFAAQYERLSIVNPTKEKFHYTLLNQTYYELLRLYSNELEKETTVVFVLGFSFSDEHIREITLRAANSNPTLIIYVIAYTHQSGREIEERLPSVKVKNSNIKIIVPARGEDDKDQFAYDFATINDRLFTPLIQQEGVVGRDQ